MGRNPVSLNGIFAHIAQHGALESACAELFSVDVPPLEMEFWGEREQWAGEQLRTRETLGFIEGLSLIPWTASGMVHSIAM